MRRFSSKHQLSTLTELNVTPLLDLAFVLLIIFMITAPLMENTLDLAVPTSSTAKTSAQPDQVQTVSVSRDSSLMLNGVPTTLQELETRLSELHTQDSQLAVVIRADQALPLQKFINVMDLLGRVGISKVGVLAHPEVTPSGS